MANIIKPKRSNTAAAVPTTGQLASGELAVNMADQKIYINNGTAVVQVGAGNLSSLGDTNISAPANGQGLSYDSATSKWVNSNAGTGDVVGPASATDNALTRFDGTTGKVVQNGTITQDDNGNLAAVNGVTFNTAPTSAPSTAGSMFWDAGDGAPSVVLNANTSLQLGQENIALVYNGTGSTINKGQVVAVSGAQGQRPSVVLADSDSEALSAPTLGISAEAIANGAEGFVCTFGLVRGIDTSAFTAGQPIYLSSTAGAFTATKPVAPQHIVALGWVVKVNASSGEVFVNINNGWELDELHNVLITSAASGNTLIYDAVAGVWENANLTAGTGISVTNGAGSITVTNSAPDQVVSLTGSGATSISGTYPNFTISSTDSGGTVTSVATGTGLSGGPITTTGTISLANTAVTPGSYTYASITVDAQGRLTDASSGASPSAFPSGTAMMFVQTSAPTGWTKSTTHDNKALRVVSGSASSGGSVAFTTAFASQTPSGTVSVSVSAGTLAVGAGTLSAASTTLTGSQIPSHRHTIAANVTTPAVYPNYTINTGNYTSGGNGGTGGWERYILAGVGTDASIGLTSAVGGGGSHSHSMSGSPSLSGSPSVTSSSFSGSAINLAVQYVDVIIATKD